METFSLRVLASDRKFFDGPCRFLTVPAPDGEAGILPGHADMIIAVVMGEIRITPEEGEQISAVVGNGFIQIVNNRAVMLVDTVELPEEIDANRAEEARRRAEERMRQKMSTQEYYHNKAALSRAMYRLKSANKKRNRKA